MEFKDLLSDLKSNRRKSIILDTDTFNEVDDQFAVTWSVLENGKGLNLLSLNAAPFYNSNSTGPEDGMIKSYNEIKKLLGLIDESGLDLTVPARRVHVYEGSRTYLPDRNTPVDSPAARNIINAVKSSSETVYVIAIGCITNVASAILMDPSIKDNMAVIWLGGHAWNFRDTREFNMVQDVPASQVIFDSQVPLFQIPACGVCDYLMTTIPELECCLKGKNSISDYLFNIVRNYTSDPYCWSKVIWDISTIACVLLPNCYDAVDLPTPILTSDCLYAFDSGRHHMLYVRRLNRDIIFKTLFTTMTK